MSVLLHTKDLAIGYVDKKQEKILQKGISVSLAAGQIVSLIGQNGVGKTTFIKSLSGLLEHLGGEIYYRDKRLDKIGRNEMATLLSIVLTEKPGNLNLTVGELIALGRHPYSSWLGVLSQEDKDAVGAAIDRTRINYIVDKKIYQLSDGQLQKVMIARALAQETPLIFLDEPTAHLDLHNKIEIMMLLREIAASGKGVLISTHDLQLSTQLSDELWLFNFNQPVITGIPEGLILDGSLAETLYLSDEEYDMMHGTIELPRTSQRIAVKGEGRRKFWTERALKRIGYTVDEQSRTTVEVDIDHWRYNEQLVSTLSELLQLIK
jgi:iron complex transport system ATP-binding protein